MGFIMLTLEIVAAVAVLLFVEGLPKLPFVLILASMMTGAVPSYFMITTARAFRSVPERATLAHFAAPFGELRRLLQTIFCGVSPRAPPFAGRSLWSAARRVPLSFRACANCRRSAATQVPLRGTR